MRELQATESSYNLRRTAENFFGEEDVDVVRFIDTEFFSRAFTDELLASAHEQGIAIDLSHAKPEVNQMVSIVLQSRRDNGYETDVDITWNSKVELEGDS